MNRNLIVIFCLFFPLFLVAGQELDLATWNIRILSDGSRDDSELALIAPIIDRYDLVAVQELRDERVVRRLLELLPGWEALVSDAVGRGVKERYAYFYRSDLVEPVGEAFVFPDPSDRFIREPYVASFRSGNFDFTLITIHLLYGKSKTDRRRELVLLDEVVDSVDFLDGEEEDQILLGDFNFDADDRGWQIDRMQPVLGAEVKTTISDRSSYDNIWIDPECSREYAGEVRVYPFDEILFDNEDRAASLAVSDHRPLSVLFATNLPDDD